MNHNGLTATNTRAGDSQPAAFATSPQVWRYQPVTDAPAASDKFAAPFASDAAQNFEADLRRVARFPHSILLTGETGTGKTWAARRIHRLSARARRPWLELNCANLPENLVEAELFGYRKGAFTGADRDHQGLFAAADGGILLLDEIGDLAPTVQNKLLKVIEEKQFKRLGTNQALACDVQIIAATSCDLPLMVQRGQFRADLYCRLAVLTLHTVPLRARTADIPPLLDYYLREAARAVGRTSPFLLTTDAVALLCAYSYPGNIRTLRNLIYELTSYVETDEPVSAALVARVLAKHSALTAAFPVSEGPSAALGAEGASPNPAAVASQLPLLAEEGDLVLPWEVCLLRRGETFPQWVARAKQCSIAAARDATGGTLSTAAARLGVTRNSLKGHWQRARTAVTETPQLS